MFNIGSIGITHCIVQYWFESGREHKVAAKPHGNSKLKRSLTVIHIWPSTMSIIKEESENNAPKDALSIIYTKQGGIMGASSQGKSPRNRLQIFNVCRKIGMY